jgi:hypothetical protein
MRWRVACLELARADTDADADAAYTCGRVMGVNSVVLWQRDDHTADSFMRIFHCMHNLHTVGGHSECTPSR